MKNLRFRTRLIIGFSIILFFSFIIGLLAIFQVQKISLDTELIYKHPLTVSNSVRDINININAIHRSMKDLALAENSEQLNKDIQLVNYSDSLIHLAFGIVKDRFLGEKSVVENTYQTYKDWEIIRNEVIELKKAGNDTGAIKITKGKGAVHVELLFAKTKILTDFAQNKADEFYNDTKNKRSESVLVLLLSILILLILSIITALIISKSISQPIYKFITEVNWIYNKNSLPQTTFPNKNEQELLSYTSTELKTTYAKLNEFNAELEQRIKKRTKALAEKSMIFDSFFNSATDSFILFDKHLNYIDANNNTLNYFFPKGTVKEDIIGKNIIEISPQIKQTERYNKYIDVIKTGVPFVVDDIVPHKNFGDYHLSIKVFKVGEGMGMVATDITEQKLYENSLKEKSEEIETQNEEYIQINEELTKAKEEAEESETYFRKIIEKSPLPMVITDKNQDIDFFNDKFSQLFGYTINDISTAEAWWQAAYPNIQYRQKVQNSWVLAIDKALKNNTDIEMQRWNLTIKDRTERICEFFMVPLGEKSLVIMNDITEKVKAEQDLFNAKEKAEEGDRLKSAFLANMSHEIRTPMNSILGFARILKKSNKTAKQKEQFVDIIEKSGNHLLNLINDIIDLSKIDANQLTVIEKKLNLNIFLLQLSEVFKNQLSENVGIVLHRDLPNGSDVIITDETRLQQILTNLIGNAVKFTRSGSIEIGYLIRNDRMIEFSVKDTGIGISEEELSFVFNRFRQADETTTRKYGGTGLGLAISKACTKLLGGEIWVKSELGKGSVFYFTIKYKPSIQSDTKQEIVNEIEPENLFEGKTILIVEDEIYSFQVLEVFLEPTNASIIHVTDGLQAIDLCKENPQIDLVLMDINLPKFNGLQTTREILKFRPNLPIISQTANAMAEDKDKSLEAGCVDYITKPINEKMLHKMINKHLKL